MMKSLFIPIVVMFFVSVEGAGNCDSYPCLNDGICSESTNSTRGYTCQCSTGYKGDNCEDAGIVEYIDNWQSSSLQKGHQFLESSNVIPYNHFKFHAKAPREIYMLLQSDKTNYDHSTGYYIIIGGWHNHVSVLEGKNTRTGFVNTPNILSDSEFRPFWISWNATTIAAGRSDKVGDNVFMSVTENKTLDIKAVSIATGPTATVHWKIPKAMNECDVDPCLNGGTCKDGISNLTCFCTRKYSGPTCADVNPCADEPCLNDGTCVPSGDNKYTCSCLTGYSGNNCEDGGIVEYTDIYYDTSYKKGQQFLERNNIIPFNHFKFSVKAPRDVYVMLQNDKSDYTYGGRKSYSIIISGWVNTISTIVGPESITDLVKTPGILSDSEFRPFWVSWNTTTVSVGQSDKVGDNVFMSVTENKILDIKAVSISTGRHSTVHWKIPKALNECDVDPCLNGGTCKDGINSLTCICSRKYTGPTCADEQ